MTATNRRVFIVLIILFAIALLILYWVRNYSELLKLPRFIPISSDEFSIHPDWYPHMRRYSLNNQSDYYISETLVTFDAYDIYTRLTFKASVDDESWGRGDRPVINVSWNDAVDYIKWLNLITFSNYRLPTESEWEYAARAGSTDRYSWGAELQKDMANCLDCQSSESVNMTTPVKEFGANLLGIYDAHGNVWEWMHDCYHKRPEPFSQSEALEQKDCDAHYVKGGSWGNKADYISPTKRFGYKSNKKDALHGFRLAYIDESIARPKVVTSDSSRAANNIPGDRQSQESTSVTLDRITGQYTNLIRNGDFSKGLGEWQRDSMWKLTWIPDQGVKGSGALRVSASGKRFLGGSTAIWQCFPIDEKQLYDFGASYRVGAESSALGGARLQVIWYENPDCTGKSAAGDWATPRKKSGWQVLEVTDTRPVAQALSVRIDVRLSVASEGESVTYWDDIYARPKYIIETAPEETLGFENTRKGLNSVYQVEDIPVSGGDHENYVASMGLLDHDIGLLKE